MKDAATFVVSEADEAKRLDRYLTDRLTELTRSRIKRLIVDGLVLVNGEKVKAGFSLKVGDRVVVEVPPPPLVTLTPEKMDLEVLYEDDDIIVVNKPPAMPVHPGAGRSSGTLVNALLGRGCPLSGTGGPIRPGIVHRLDMDTTGALVVAKNDPAHTSLAAQFKAHSTSRRYIALVWGTLKSAAGVIDLPLGRSSSDRKKISTRTRKSRRAVTKYRVLKEYPGLALLELTPETGRTHQLRVHLNAIHHSIVGDQHYGNPPAVTALAKPVTDALKSINRQMLHAETLGLIHPSSGALLDFKAEMPPDMAGLVKLLDEHYGEE
jgi:23S rRNA pseudouridine1911/1915/1917 synthase